MVNELSEVSSLELHVDLDLILPSEFDILVPLSLISQLAGTRLHGIRIRIVDLSLMLIYPFQRQLMTTTDTFALAQT